MIEVGVMNVVDKPISWVKPYDNNPRNNDEAMAAVRASLKEFGFQQPIVCDKDGIIIVGHTRFKAAISLSMKTVPVVIADKLTPTQVKAYRLADNKVGELAEWDDDRLMMEIADLMQDGFDLAQYGFSKEDLQLVEASGKADNRWLEDFNVLPAPKPAWILIKAQEDVAAEMVSTLRKAYKSPAVMIHYSGEAPP